MNPEKTSVIRARDIMRQGVITNDGMATAREAAAKMREERFSALVVIKRRPDDAWGIVVIQDNQLF